MQIVTRGLAALVLGSGLLLPTATHASSTRQTLPTISLAMNGTSITVLGTLQSGAVDIRSTTTREPFGNPLFVRLKPGVTVQQFYAFLDSKASQDVNSVARYGAIVMDAGSPRGVSHVQTWLQPGQYIAFDSSQQNKPPLSWPHTTFSIVQAAHPAALPAAQATIHILDFGFRGPSTLRVGELVRTYNNGYLVHMADAIGARDLQAAQKIVTGLRAGQDKQVQHLATHRFIAFAGPLSHNAFQQSVIPAMPGYYVLACFMDTQDGREHTRIGMERVIRVIR